MANIKVNNLQNTEFKTTFNCSQPLSMKKLTAIKGGCKCSIKNGKLVCKF
jgi:hypothetical protein